MDFGWFEQKGNVYSDFENHSNYTKYVNLHLGAAYDSMTPREYCEFMGDSPIDGIYYKPGSFPMNGKKSLSDMLNKGCLALKDAFEVIKHKHVLNIYNTSTKRVETFDKNHV